MDKSVDLFIYTYKSITIVINYVEKYKSGAVYYYSTGNHVIHNMFFCVCLLYAYHCFNYLLLHKLLLNILISIFLKE